MHGVDCKFELVCIDVEALETETAACLHEVLLDGLLFVKAVLQELIDIFRQLSIVLLEKHREAVLKALRVSCTIYRQHERNNQATRLVNLTHFLLHRD